MGKVRIKQIGTTQENLEEKTATAKAQKKQKREESVVAQIAEPKKHTPKKSGKPSSPPKSKERRRVRPRQLHGRSKRYQKTQGVSRSESPCVNVEEAVNLAKKTATASFSETIEAHINLQEKFQTSIQLPHGNKLELKTEKKAPVIHTKIGKADMNEKELTENLKALIKALPEKKIKKITLSPTMGPSIRLVLS